MKKQILHIVLVAVLILGMSSCNKFDEQTDNNSNSSVTPTDTTSTSDTSSRGEWIDLGLPSGLLWYSVNIGASTPTEVGDLYAWGETETKYVYKWSTYKYATVDAQGNLSTLTKYNTTDNTTVLEPEDDAATAVIGNGARIPTIDEWQELIVYTSQTQDNNGNVTFLAANGRSILLPHTGRGSSTSYYYYGYYWSSNMCTQETQGLASGSYPQYAQFLYWIGGSGPYVGGATYNSGHKARYEGLPIRAVRQAR